MTNENRDNGSSATALMERAAAELEATAARVTQEALMRGVERGIREALPTMLATVSRALGGVMGGGGVVVREMPAQYAEPQQHVPVLPDATVQHSTAKAATAAPAHNPQSDATAPSLEIRPELRAQEAREPEARQPAATPAKKTSKPTVAGYFSPAQAAALCKVKGQRRSADAMAKLEAASLYVISQHPGLRAEELAPLVGLPPAELRDVFVRLMNSPPRVSTTGSKHGVRYYPLPAS